MTWLSRLLVCLTALLSLQACGHTSLYGATADVPKLAEKLLKRSPYQDGSVDFDTDLQVRVEGKAALILLDTSVLPWNPQSTYDSPILEGIESYVHFSDGRVGHADGPGKAEGALYWIGPEDVVEGRLGFARMRWDIWPTWCMECKQNEPLSGIKGKMKVGYISIPSHQLAGLAETGLRAFHVIWFQTESVEVYSLTRPEGKPIDPEDGIVVRRLSLAKDAPPPTQRVANLAAFLDRLRKVPGLAVLVDRAGF